MQLYQAFKLTIAKALKPQSVNKDDARREFILNVLLLGLLLLSSTTFLINLVNPYFDKSYNGASPIVSAGLLVFLFFLLKLSKSSNSKLSAYIFIISLTVFGSYMHFYWGADLPTLLLFFALLVVMSGILINSKFAFAIALAGGTSVVVFTQLELAGLVKPNDLWKKQPIEMVDSVANAVILGIIAMVSWLFNREMERALKRARRSEDIVKKQRDNLEVLVDKRTRELRLVQAEKFSQLYRFAELGRMATGIFHDLATPLSLVSLNLDQLREENKKGKQLNLDISRLHMNRALDGTKRLENFLSIARKQVQNDRVKEWFSLYREVEQTILILEYRAKKNKVRVEKGIYEDVTLYGSSAKFGQVMSNLISNAIDAYTVSSKKRVVEVGVEKNEGKLIIEVKDWGVGIDKKNYKKIFEPLFTTKGRKKGLGMGLSICKDVVEKEFRGKITVESSKEKGTIFTVVLPHKEKPQKS